MTDPPVTAAPVETSSAPPPKKKAKTYLDSATANALSTCVSKFANDAPGVASLLQQNLQNGNPTLPSVETVRQVVQKMLLDSPVHPHWSKTDTAEKAFKADSRRLVLHGALRGYRMCRGTTGVQSQEGSGYFECLILEPPSAASILQQLPPHARLGPGLRRQLEREAQQQQQQQQHNNNNNSACGHVRVGWSMRTGDLQAPVGYDTWSYGLRSLNGSILHHSQRQDDWGGEAFGPGDVVGCHLRDSEIRFTKNAHTLGQFELVKSKLVGGVAFGDVRPGTYYPAVSTYMGGAVRANFGPYWMMPPKKTKLPHVQSLVVEPKPVTLEKLFKKPEQQAALEAAVAEEYELRKTAYQEYLDFHVEQIRAFRTERGLSVNDLPPPKESKDNDGVKEETGGKEQEPVKQETIVESKD